MSERTYEDDARRVPLFLRAAVRPVMADGSVSPVVGVVERFMDTEPPMPIVRWPDLAEPRSHHPTEHLMLDLTDPMTSGEVLRLLALEKGAPAEEVEQGTLLWPEAVHGSIGWVFCAGADWAVRGRWVARDIPASDRPAAIARAWAEHLDEVARGDH